ncbi:MAG: azurin [Bacteroidia bacterium]
MKKILFIPSIAVMALLASCGSKEPAKTEQPTMETPAAAPAETETQPAESAASAVTDHITLTGDDQMKYDGYMFKIKAGQDVKLTMTNAGKLPKEAMGHNVVILAKGTDVAAFAKEAAKDKADGYIPASMKSSIIAHTKTLGPGETDEITFKIDAPGEYDFICSFPGHYITMKGKIVVE